MKPVTVLNISEYLGDCPEYLIAAPSKPAEGFVEFANSVLSSINSGDQEPRHIPGIPASQRGTPKWMLIEYLQSLKYK